MEVGAFEAETREIAGDSNLSGRRLNTASREKLPVRKRIRSGIRPLRTGFYFLIAENRAAAQLISMMRVLW